MKGGELKRVAERIRRELRDLERVLDRIVEVWQLGRRQDDDFYLDSVALNLYGFYSGLERIFTLIGEAIDGALPSGDNRQKKLLRRMSEANPPVRPAVISASAGKALGDYLVFSRAIYFAHAYRFDAPKMEPLVKSASDLFAQLKAELSAFAAFLEG